ncbi:hypothetical protein ACG7TL_002240 [Trametes sanguinea]
MTKSTESHLPNGGVKKRSLVLRWSGSPTGTLSSSPTTSRPFASIAVSSHTIPRYSRLHPAFDLACLLRALYDGAKFQANRLGARPPFPVVAALVELSHKYDMGHLREEALRRFRLCLPHRFSDFISRVNIVNQQQSQGDGDTFGPTLESPALHISADRDVIRTANLVRLVDDNRMLPMALYLCAQLSVAALLDGTEGDDGRMHTLCREDQARCLQARMVLSERNHRKMARIWGLSVARSCCAHSKKCHSIYRSQAKEELPEMVSSTPPNPLSSMDPRLRASGLCDARIAHLLEEEKKEMLMIWEKLPGDLGLSVPQWNYAPPT